MNTHAIGPARHVDLLVLGQLAGAARALEQLLFEVLGSWARTVDEPALRPVLATCAHHHAWHAELWARRAPSVPGADIAAATAAGRVRTEALESRLRGLSATGDRLAAVFGVVVPRYAAWCSSMRAALDERLDPSTARVLDLVTRDLDDDLRAIGRLDAAPAAMDLDVLDGALGDVEVLRPRG